MAVEPSNARVPGTGWVAARPGVEVRPLVGGEGTALVLFRFEPGIRFLPHRHPYPEYGTVISGRGRFLLEPRSRDLTEGDSYYIPSGVAHGFETAPQSGPIVLLHVSVGSPVGERPPMFRELLGQARRLTRPTGAEEGIPLRVEMTRPRARGLSPDP